MENIILDYIKKNNLIEENDKVLVGVSGGPDSMCLLNILYNLKDILKIELFVAHVNHLIREEAKLDAEYVNKYCKSKNIKFFLKESNIKEISKKQKIGLEETGRNVRYEFFEEISNRYNINKIAIGHNKNDLAETLIMNILRGTGTKGLKGIMAKSLSKKLLEDSVNESVKKPYICYNFKTYIRPLLNTNREEIEEYCRKNKINPRIDTTNYENEYTRNKIRNIVIPYIKQEFNPNIIEALVKLSRNSCRTRRIY